MNKYIVYLAAGNSRRFGSNKLLYEFQGKKLYRHGLDMLISLQEKCEDIFITLVTQYEEIYEETRKDPIKRIFSKECQKGVSYTIKEALAALTDASEEDYIFFVVADQPYLSEKTMINLLSCAETGAETASVAWGETPGNPTMFSLKLKEELFHLTEDQGGRKVIRNHPCIYVQAEDEKEIWDIDENPMIEGKRNWSNECKKCK